MTELLKPHIFLIGGFGNSPYLRKQLRAWFEPMGVQVTTLDDATTSAPVAEGAIMWYHANQVIKRAPRWAYGTETDVPFDEANAEHCDRTRISKPSGTYVDGKWFQLVPKGTLSESIIVCRQSHTREYRRPDPDLGKLDEGLYAYSYDGSPGWLKTTSGELLTGFRKTYFVTADLSGLQKALQPRINAQGIQYWALAFNLCFSFDCTELVVFVEWLEEGVIKTMRANVTPSSAV